MKIAIYANVPRKPLVKTSMFPYHVFARSNNKEWFFLPLAQCWEIFCEKLSRVEKRYAIELTSFVLMSNHLHMIIRPLDGDLGPIMNYFLREVSRTMGRNSGRINHIFGGPYKGCLISDPIYFAHVYKYVFRNPVEAGICKGVEDYRFSTISEQNLPFKVLRYDELLLNRWIPQNRTERILWLNRAHKQKQIEVIERALKKTEFKLPKGKNSRKIRECLALP